MECGNRAEEIRHAVNDFHTFAEMRIFGDLTLVLCDFCQVDFGSFHPDFFGLPRDARIGLKKMQFVRSIEEIRINKDKVCSECGYRLPFLQFVQQARKLHQEDD